MAFQTPLFTNQIGFIKLTITFLALCSTNFVFMKLTQSILKSTMLKKFQDFPGNTSHGNGSV